jgi:hypothetical protein
MKSYFKITLIMFISILVIFLFLFFMNLEFSILRYSNILFSSSIVFTFILVCFFLYFHFKMHKGWGGVLVIIGLIPASLVFSLLFNYSINMLFAYFTKIQIIQSRCVVKAKNIYIHHGITYSLNLYILNHDRLLSHSFKKEYYDKTEVGDTICVEVHQNKYGLVYW